MTGQSPFSREGEESNQSVISTRIQKEAPNIPSSVSTIFQCVISCHGGSISLQIGNDARDFIEKLLQKNPKDRLGFRNDAEDLKKHKFFKRIDWAKLKNRIHNKAPMIPPLSGEDDVSQFSEDFTKQSPEDKDVEAPAARNAANYFRGYSFVAPQWRRNPVQEVTLVDRPEPSSRPKVDEVLMTQKLVSSATNCY